MEPTSMKLPRRIISTAFLMVGVLALSTSEGAAQTPVSPASTSSQQRAGESTRAELTAMATAAEQAAAASGVSAVVRDQKLAEARTLRERLTEGDMRVGDRLVLVVLGEPALTDTFAVRTGQMLVLPGVGDIPLRGVLRSELRDYLMVQIGRFVKNPEVRAHGLIRLAVLGEVGAPGFYSFPPDTPLADAIMRAGGPSGAANLAKAEIRRETKRLIPPAESSRAIRQGKTLDQLSLRAGDEIVVPAKVRRDWQSVLQVVSLLAGVGFGIYGVSRGF